MIEDSVAESVTARVGATLNGKYRLDRVLGVGGMAAVYAATHRNSKRFAIKMLHPELSLRRDLRTRFLREGYVATQVGHPGAVSVLDDDVSEDGSAFLVMELLEGATVDALWERRQNRLPLAAVLAIGHQLLDVLSAAHAKGIVHRDIKPENLFLTTEGQLKVLDFGIARVKDAASSSATNTGTVLGTPLFMAPEQAMGKISEIGPQSDLWSAGAVLFTLLSGRYVHDGESAQHIAVKAATIPAPSLAQVWPEAPMDVVHLVDAALSFDKATRWANAAAMQRGIVAAAHAAIGSVPSRQALVELLAAATSVEVERDPPPEASTLRQAATPPSTSTVDDAPTKIQGGASPAIPFPLERAARPPGLSTDQPVWNDGRATSPSRNRVALIALGGGALAAALIAALLLRPQHHDDSPAFTPATGAPAPSAPLSAAPGPDPSPPKAVEPATVSLDQLPSEPRKAPQGAATPTSAPNAKTPTPGLPTAPHTAPPPAANPPAAQAPAAKSNCTPPFTRDPATGIKRWKPECM